jgi:hypothetical protein
MLLDNAIEMRRKVYKHATHAIDYRCHLSSLENNAWLKINLRLTLLLHNARWSDLSTLVFLFSKLQK